VPEQVEPSATDQVLSGKAHDLAYLLTVTGAIAVYLAVLAGRFLFKRAAQAALERVSQKIGAPGTYRVLVQGQTEACQFIASQRRPCALMMSTTVD
jgi:hypothetical protein